MNRDETLNTAQNVVNGHRQKDYGDVRENFERIAKLWSQVLNIEVDANQVALCMIQVKVARLATTPDHTDSWVDIAGYAALGSEVATDEPSFTSILGGTDPKLATSAVPIIINTHDIHEDAVDEVVKKAGKR